MKLHYQPSVRYSVLLLALILFISSSTSISGSARAATPQTQPHPTQFRVQVTIENLAPNLGTFQTPFWVGFHNGQFDIYDRNKPASFTFPNVPNALESLAEDGNNEPITEAFAIQAPNGVDATLPGPDGPIAPGDIATGTFLLDAQNGEHRYFSYASMILPSNDFFVANGNPLAYEIFDEEGNFVATDFFITGAQVLDAGTEVNDEIPENTAFFGQQTPNTGIDENGVVIGLEEGLTGFLRPGSGGILDDSRFRAADFVVGGYPVAKISFTAVPAVVESRIYYAELNGNNEVPPVDTRARGLAVYRLVDEGERLTFTHLFRDLRNVVGAHLHLGKEGENGSVVALLLDPDNFDEREVRRILRGELTSADLTGPLAGLPLDALIKEIEAGNIYVNIHTDDGNEPPNTGPGDFADGEIRGQLRLPDR